MKLKELRALLALPVLLTRSGDSALRRLLLHDCRNRTKPCRCNRTKPRRRWSDGKEGSDRNDGSDAERTEATEGTACASCSEPEREPLGAANKKAIIYRRVPTIVNPRFVSVARPKPLPRPICGTSSASAVAARQSGQVRLHSPSAAVGGRNCIRRRRASRAGWKHSGENRWHMRVYNRDKKTE